MSSSPLSFSSSSSPSSSSPSFSYQDASCRICRGEATPEEPLYHPCKCNGSIKYVHQDCLIDWLKHSKKSAVCELCNTPYNFTKVYDPNMPRHLPLIVFLKNMAQSLTRWVKSFFRFILVIMVWTIYIPHTARYMLRYYIRFADQIPVLPPVLFRNSTRIIRQYKPQETRSTFIIIPKKLTIDTPGWIKDLTIDISEGQTLILFLLLLLLVVLVVREWILQNEVFINDVRDINEDARARMDFRPAAVGIQADPPPAMRLRHLRNDHENVIDDVLRRHLEQVAAVGRLPGGFAGGEEALADDMLAVLADRVGDGIAAGPNLGVNAAAQAPANAPAAAAVDAVDPDDAPGEDFDGILHLAGLTGPIRTFFQNAFACTVGVISAIAILFLIPYVIGRLVVLMTSAMLFPWRMITFVRNGLWIISVNVCSIVISFPGLALNSGASKFINFVHKQQKYLANSEKLTVELPTVLERIGITSIGYLSIISAGYYYINSGIFLTRTPRAHAVERTVIRLLRQCGSILKVITVIGIELVVFPIFSGILLHWSVLPLAKNATILQQFRLTIDHPFVSTLLHWFFGTCYMFQFATFVSLCRKIMRPGVLYFVRDPNEPNFHPIRDVLERRLSSHLGKIGISALIYLVLICFCIGGVLWSMRYVFHFDSLLPIELGDSVSDVLSFTHLILPYLCYHMEPYSALQEYWLRVFDTSCRKLRLSSFILKKAAPKEQGTVYYNNVAAYWRGAEPDYTRPGFSTEEGVTFVKDGYFVRAPNFDSIHSRRNLKLFIPVSKDDERLDGLHTNQDNELEDYVVVYRPPGFKFRITGLLMIIWLSGGFAVFSVTGLPILFGRALAHLTGSSTNSFIRFYLDGLIIQLCLIQFIARFDNVVNYLKALIRLRRHTGPNEHDVTTDHNVTDNTDMIPEQIVRDMNTAMANGFDKLFPYVVNVVLLVLLEIPLLSLIWLYFVRPTGFQMSLLQFIEDTGLITSGTEVFVFFLLKLSGIGGGFLQRYEQLIHLPSKKEVVIRVFQTYVLPSLIFITVALTAPSLLCIMLTFSAGLFGYSADIDKWNVLSYPCFLAVYMIGNAIRLLFYLWGLLESKARDQYYLVGQQLQNMEAR